MLSIVKNNIKLMWKTKKSFMVMMVLVQALVAFSIMFVTGAMASDYMSLKEDLGGNMISVYTIEDVEKSAIYYKDIEPMFFEIDEEMGNIYDGIFVGFDKGQMVDDDIFYYNLRYGINKGKYVLDNVWTNNIQYWHVEGRKMSEADLRSDEFIGIYRRDGMHPDTVLENKKIGDVEVKIIGTYEGYNTEITLNPAAARCINMKVDSIALLLNRILTDEEHLKLNSIVDKYIGGTYIDMLETYSDSDRKSIIKSSMTTSIISGIACFFVLAIIYSYFFDVRKKNIAIFQLSGCSRGKTIALMLGEMLLVSIPSVAVGMGLFYLCQLWFLNDMFFYLKIVVTRELYTIYFLAFFVIIAAVFVIMSILYSSKSIKSQLVETGR